MLKSNVNFEYWIFLLTKFSISNSAYIFTRKRYFAWNATFQFSCSSRFTLFIGRFVPLHSTISLISPFLQFFHTLNAQVCLANSFHPPAQAACVYVCIPLIPFLTLLHTYNMHMGIWLCGYVGIWWWKLKLVAWMWVWKP